MGRAVCPRPPDGSENRPYLSRHKKTAPVKERFIGRVRRSFSEGGLTGVEFDDD